MLGWDPAKVHANRKVQDYYNTFARQLADAQGQCMRCIPCLSSAAHRRRRLRAMEEFLHGASVRLCLRQYLAGQIGVLDLLSSVWHAETAPSVQLWNTLQSRCDQKLRHDLTEISCTLGHDSNFCCAGWWATHGSSIMLRRNPQGNPQHLAALHVQASNPNQGGASSVPAGPAAGSAAPATARSHAEDAMAFALTTELWRNAKQPLQEMADSSMQAAMQVPTCRVR